MNDTTHFRLIVPTRPSVWRRFLRLIGVAK